MNKIAMISMSALGGTALFAVAFLGFAKMNGVPLHSLPAVGGMFPPEPEDAASSEIPGASSTPVPEAHATDTTAAATTKPEGSADAKSHDATTAAAAPTPKPAPALPSVPSHVARAGVFDLMDTDGLYTQDELRALADSLRAKNRETDQRTAELDRREDLLVDRLTALDERRRTMEDFAKQLDARERELKAREAEASRDAKTGEAKDGKKLPAGDLSDFFSDGETEILVQRLAGFSADETAQILIRLTPARAKELLDALPSTRWRECAEAYARAAQKPPP